MDVNILDKIRTDEGKEKCKEYFYNMVYKNRKEALKLINDDKLSFPCFYQLLPMLSQFRLYQNLTLDKKLAVNILNQIVIPETYYRGNDYLSERNDEVYAILLWMAQTGSDEEDASDEYEQIMDVVVAALINIYNENKILPNVSNMIFKRNKKDKFISDLVWAYFQSKDIEAVKLIAQRLRSEDNSEVNLAKRLLNINGIIINKEKYYNKYINWLKENDNYLYFTEESNQFTSNPVPVKADIEKKYLHKVSASYEKTPVITDNKKENQCLAVFSTLDNKDKELLSDFSHKLFKKNKKEWENWINSPIEEQLRYAKTDREDYL